MLTHEARSVVDGTIAGVAHVICVAVWLTTLHGSEATVTTLLLALLLALAMTCSKPLPLTVNSVPPPAEPTLGETPVIATT